MSNKSPTPKQMRFNVIKNEIDKLGLLTNEKKDFGLVVKPISKITNKDIVALEENYSKYIKDNSRKAIGKGRGKTKLVKTEMPEKPLSKSTSEESMTSSQGDQMREMMNVIGQEGVSQVHTLSSIQKGKRKASGPKDEFMVLKLRSEKAQEKYDQQRDKQEPQKKSQMKVEDMESFLMPSSMGGGRFTDSKASPSEPRTINIVQYIRSNSRFFPELDALPTLELKKIESEIKKSKNFGYINTRFYNAERSDPVPLEKELQKIVERNREDKYKIPEPLSPLNTSPLNFTPIVEDKRPDPYTLSHNLTQVNGVDHDGNKDGVAPLLENDSEVIQTKQTAGTLPEPTYATPAYTPATPLPAKPQGPYMVPKYIAPRTISTTITDAPTVGDSLDRSNPSLSYGTSYISNGQIQINKSPEQVAQDSLNTLTGIAEKTPAGQEYLNEINKKMMALDAQIQMLKNMNNPPAGIKTERLSDRKVYPKDIVRTNDPYFTLNTGQQMDGTFKNNKLIKPFVN